MKKAIYEFDVASDYDFGTVYNSLDRECLTIISYKRKGPGGGNQMFQVEGIPSVWAEWCSRNLDHQDPEMYRV